jgi:hypothetical protein
MKIQNKTKLHNRKDKQPMAQQKDFSKFTKLERKVNDYVKRKNIKTATLELEVWYCNSTIECGLNEEYFSEFMRDFIRTEDLSKSDIQLIYQIMIERLEKLDD